MSSGQADALMELLDTLTIGLQLASFLRLLRSLQPADTMQLWAAFENKLEEFTIQGN